MRKELSKALRIGKAAPVELKAPTIRVEDPELIEPARDAQQAIRAAYRDASLEAEIQLLLALQAERDDKEALLLLL